MSNISSLGKRKRSDSKGSNDSNKKPNNNDEKSSASGFFNSSIVDSSLSNVDANKPFLAAQKPFVAVNLPKEIKNFDTVLSLLGLNEQYTSSIKSISENKENNPSNIAYKMLYLNDKIFYLADDSNRLITQLPKNVTYVYIHKNVPPEAMKYLPENVEKVKVLSGVSDKTVAALPASVKEVLVFPHLGVDVFQALADKQVSLFPIALGNKMHDFLIKHQNSKNFFSKMLYKFGYNSVVSFFNDKSAISALSNKVTHVTTLPFVGPEELMALPDTVNTLTLVMPSAKLFEAINEKKHIETINIGKVSGFNHFNKVKNNDLNSTENNFLDHIKIVGLLEGVTIETVLAFSKTVKNFNIYSGVSGDVIDFLVDNEELNLTFLPNKKPSI